MSASNPRQVMTWHVRQVERKGGAQGRSTALHACIDLYRERQLLSPHMVELPRRFVPTVSSKKAGFLASHGEDAQKVCPHREQQRQCSVGSHLLQGTHAWVHQSMLQAF